MKFFERAKLRPHERWVEDAAPVLGTRADEASFMGTAVSPQRILVCGIIALSILFLLYARAAQLQLFNGNEWRRIAERNRLRTIQLIPERGIFFDRNHVPLVANIPTFRLTVRAQDLPRDPTERTTAIQTLASLVGLDADRTDQVIRSLEQFQYSSVILRDGITYENAVSIYLRSADYPSMTIERGARRQYVQGIAGQQEPSPRSLAHVLGYVGRISADELSQPTFVGYVPTDTTGRAGLESLFEPLVRGTPGIRDTEVDVRGRERSMFAVQEPRAGDHVVLSIDVEIQEKLEQTLRGALARAGRARGAAVALDPRSGEVLGMVSLPAYDNNEFAGSISTNSYKKLLDDQNQPLLNRAVGGQFPSGSTLKPFIAAAALQEKIITPESTINSTGGIAVGKWFFPDWKEGGHGTTDVSKAIAWSVNSFFYTIGGGYGERVGLGPERIKKYLEYFGFGRITGSGLVGEQRGVIPSPQRKMELTGEPWYIGDTYNMSIGQGDILVTPLQMAVATAAIANGGTIWKPQWARERIAPNGSVTMFLPERAALVPVSAEHLATIRAAMRSTVTAGSAPSLRQLSFAVAGKTGTAQWSKTKNPHAWFMSFAPYDAPEIVTVFLIEEGNEGGVVSVPAAREFYEWWGEYRKNYPQ